jgi:hypothetical protein
MAGSERAFCLMLLGCRALGRTPSHSSFFPPPSSSFFFYFLPSSVPPCSSPAHPPLVAQAAKNNKSQNASHFVFNSVWFVDRAIVSINRQNNKSSPLSAKSPT